MFAELAGPAIVSAACTLLVLLVSKRLNRRAERAGTEKAELEAEVLRLSYVKGLEDRVGALEGRVEQLERERDDERAQVRKLKSLWRSTVMWAITLRDQALAAGADVPPMPPDVELALTTLDTTE